MSTVILLLFQLWNQPSVRILGLGEYFTGYIPDPITDLILNPANLKDIGSDRYDETFNSLQIYTITQRFEESFDSVINEDIRTFLSEVREPLSCLIFYPKLGLGFKGGVFTRYDERDHGHIEEWLYIQGGIFGALNFGEYLKIGGEYNFSENDKSDRFEVSVPDSPYVTQSSIDHYEWSNEFGVGIIVGDYSKIDWQLSFSFRKNCESDSFDVAAFSFWPEDWKSQWQERREDFRILASIVGGSYPLQVVLKIDYYDQMWIHKMYYTLEDSTIIEFAAFEPGIGVLYYPQKDIMLAAAVTYSSWYDIGAPTKAIIGSVGFEKKFGSLLKFRFGNTAILRTDYNHRSGSHDYFTKNELNLGLELRPHEKLSLHIATQEPFEFSEWFFGLSFAL